MGRRWKWKDISPRLGQSERPTGLPGKRQKRKELGNEDDTKIIRELFFPSILSLTPLHTHPKVPFLSLIFCSPARESLWKGKIWDRLKQSQIQTVNLSWWSALSVFKGDVLLSKCCPRTFPSFFSLHLVHSQLKNKMAVAEVQLRSWHLFKTSPPSQQTFNPKAKSYTNRRKI